MIFKHLIFFVVLYSSSSFCSNSIIAVVNDEIISTNQFSKSIKKNLTSKEKIKALEFIVNEVLISQKIKQLKISINPKAIEDELNRIALENNLTLEELTKLANFQQIRFTVNQALSKKALKDIIVSNELKKIETESIYSSKEHDELFNKWLDNLRNNSYIYIYDDKLK